jgi:hypothetical protein
MGGASGEQKTCKGGPEKGRKDKGEGRRKVKWRDEEGVLPCQNFLKDALDCNTGDVL